MRKMSNLHLRDRIEACDRLGKIDNETAGLLLAMLDELDRRTSAPTTAAEPEPAKTPTRGERWAERSLQIDCISNIIRLHSDTAKYKLCDNRFLADHNVAEKTIEHRIIFLRWLLAEIIDAACAEARREAIEEAAVKLEMFGHNDLSLDETVRSIRALAETKTR